MGNLSKFPQQIDEFVTLYDIPPSLMVKAKRYQELKMKPVLNATEQNELNSLSGELQEYIITPQTWNKFADAVVNMETFIKTNIDGYISTKQTEWADYIKNFKLIGTHNESNMYKFQNMVKDSQGNLYIAIKDVPSNIEITNTTYWQQISTKGDKGDVGLNASLKGVYSNSVTYSVGDAVVYDGNIYYCIQDTTAGVSPTNSNYWLLYDRLYVGSTEPSYKAQGLSWIKIQ